MLITRLLLFFTYIPTIANGFIQGSILTMEGAKIASSTGALAITFNASDGFHQCLNELPINFALPIDCPP